MKMIIMGLIITAAIPAISSSNYECHNVLREEKILLKLRTNTFNHKLKSITVINAIENKLDIKDLNDPSESLLAELSNSELEALPLEYVLHANTLNYKMVRDGDILQMTDYYYLSDELFQSKRHGVLMIRDDYSCGPFPRSCTRNKFYECFKS